MFGQLVYASTQLLAAAILASFLSTARANDGRTPNPADADSLQSICMLSATAKLSGLRKAEFVAQGRRAQLSLTAPSIGDLSLDVNDIYILTIFRTPGSSAGSRQVQVMLVAPEFNGDATIEPSYNGAPIELSGYDDEMKRRNVRLTDCNLLEVLANKPQTQTLPKPDKSKN